MNSHGVVQWAWQQDVTATQKLVLLALACQCDDHGRTFAGRGTIARRCGIDPSGVSRHLRALEDLYLILRRNEGEILLLTGTTAVQNRTEGVQNRTPSRAESHTPPAPPNRASATASGTDTSPTPPWGELPAGLDEEPVRAALESYDRHRREKRSAMTPTAWRGLLKKLEPLGPERATEALLHSIANGWTGVFPPNGNGHAAAGEGPYKIVDYDGNLRRVTAAQYRNLTGVDPPLDTF